MHPQTILVTGADGQLGKQFRSAAHGCEQFEFLFAARDSLDISDEQEIDRIFSKFAPDFCINCAAYTAVDRAENEREKALLLNDTSIDHLINGCRIHNTKLICFSTDYVYDSVYDRPILEDDERSPRSVYGKSKMAGELKLENSDLDWVNIRVSWLYSSFGNNFVKTMLRLGNEKNVLKVVNDQTGSPTFARDLVNAVLTFVEINEDNLYRNHYNYSNLGETNWADFTREIFRLSDVKCEVLDISTEEFGAIAPRPHWSVLSKDKIKAATQIKIPHWIKSLEECISLLQHESLG